jgi:riboflavin kinase, archaea type
MVLYRLAEMGAFERSVALSTSLVASRLGVSQQTASRRLIDMENEGLIERTTDGRSQKVRITKQGFNALGEMYKTLKPIFETPKRDLELNAVLFSGLSEGSYYMSLEGYRRQFRSKLGFDPFPGTLNLRIVKDSMSQRSEMNAYPHVDIEEFADKNRTYGGARCYKAIVQRKIEGAIVVPIRAHYGEDVLEIIAPENLRKRLRLKDGDAVSVQVPSRPS